MFSCFSFSTASEISTSTSSFSPVLFSQILAFNSQPIAFSYWGVAALVMVFFLVSWLRDPGYVSSKPNPQFQELVNQLEATAVCPDCESVKSLRSRHCAICKKCVERYDHHCPWINNCVGTRNHGAFYCFISFILIQLVSSLALTTYLFSRVVKNSSFEIKGFFPDIRVFDYLREYQIVFYILLIGLMLYFIFFTLMVLALWCGQTKNLLLARTSFERLNKSNNIAHQGMHGEIVSPETDACSLKNCVFMCCRCEIPRQEELKDAILKEQFKSSESLLHSACELETSRLFYEQLVFSQEYQEADDASVSNGP
eukprot:TRINITY_DN10526_c0_g1_i1.p1 TRINITY_DN10526_c0_g1~~TRINITY_DN10526_c0_g1_i1.p1  ORF type:complete len:312 (+),score=31.15 TRINITY_DN10526_c0_g1_i1:1162-2097(+)